jgi:hypothetical protein
VNADTDDRRRKRRRRRRRRRRRIFNVVGVLAFMTPVPDSVQSVRAADPSQQPE